MFTKSMFRIFTLLFVMIALLTVALLPVQAKSSARPLQASGDFIWARGTGGTGSDAAQAIAVGSTGNVYTIGSFQGTVDFDPGAGTFNLTSVNTRDSFISKLDGNGNLLWAKTIGAIDLYQIIGIALDSNENIYLTRGFQGGTSAGDTNIIVSKLDSDGNFIWAGNIGGTGSYESRAIALDSSGNVYTLGWFTDTNLLPGDGYFISKLNSDGELVWVKSISTNAALIKKFAVDTSGNVYITGGFLQTIDFDPGAGIANLTSVGGPDIFILKLDGDGNFIWAKSMGGIDHDGAFGIALDSSGNPYLMGVYALTVDFDPNAGVTNLTSNGHNIFICKLDASGNFVWVRSTAITSGSSIGSTDLDITIDVNNNVYTTSIFSGTVDFDPGAGTANLTSAGNSDIFISKLDGNGSFMWAKRMGGTQTDESSGIALDLSGNLYTAGYFTGTADFDPGAGTASLTSAGNTDIFISKLENDTLAPTATATGTITPTASETLTPTVTATETVTPTATETAMPTATGTFTATPTASATETATPTATGTFTATPTASATGTATPTRTATPLTDTFQSFSGHDGWVLESSETSGTGGTLNKTAGTLFLGDDSAKKQYRSILSFSTARLPDTAIINSVMLRLKKHAIFGGGEPATLLQGWMVDIKTGFFGSTSALQLEDFQSPASTTYGPLNPTLMSGSYYYINLSAKKAFINKLTANNGLTQFRLRFKLDDNNNAIANYISLYSGDSANLADRPQLVIGYTMP